MTDKRSDRVWSEDRFSRLSLTGVQLDLEFAHSKSVCDVDAGHDQVNRLPLFHSDLNRLKCKPLRCDLNVPRRF